MHSHVSAGDIDCGARFDKVFLRVHKSLRLGFDSVHIHMDTCFVDVTQPKLSTLATLDGKNQFFFFSCVI